MLITLLVFASVSVEPSINQNSISLFGLQFAIGIEWRKWAQVLDIPFVVFDVRKNKQKKRRRRMKQ